MYAGVHKLEKSIIYTINIIFVYNYNIYIIYSIHYIKPRSNA
jgi:hypothetical protein